MHNWQAEKKKKVLDMILKVGNKKKGEKKKKVTKDFELSYMNVKKKKKMDFKNIIVYIGKFKITKHAIQSSPFRLSWLGVFSVLLFSRPLTWVYFFRPCWGLSYRAIPFFSINFLIFFRKFRWQSLLC